MPAVKYSELFCCRFQLINDYLRFSLLRFNWVSCCFVRVDEMLAFLLLSYSFSFFGWFTGWICGFEPIKSSRKLLAASVCGWGRFYLFYVISVWWRWGVRNECWWAGSWRELFLVVWGLVMVGKWTGRCELPLKCCFNPTSCLFLVLKVFNYFL